METVVTMVQVARRGDVETAAKIWTAIQAEEYFDAPIFMEPLGAMRSTPALLVARCIWEFLAHDTLRSDVDLASVQTRMDGLAKEFPDLFNAADWASKDRARFLKDLAATVAAPKPVAGSIEALVIEWANFPDRYGQADYFSRMDTGDRYKPAQAIFHRGLEAIAGLTALLNDPRITRHVSQAPMKKPEERLRLGQVAGRLLDDLTGSQGRGAAAELKAHPRPEREFFEDAAVTVENGLISRLYPVPLWFLGQSHPEALQAVCTKIPAGCKPDVQLFDLAHLVLTSRLPEEARIQAVSGMAQRLGKDPRRRSVLQNFAKVDPKGCAAMLLPILKGLPKDVDEPYWTCEPASYQHVVMQLEIDEVWKEYLKAVRKAAVGLRMEMMNAMNYGYIGDKNRERRIALLAEFLDDSELRDRNSSATKFQGPCAGFTIARLEVRNYVAEKLSYMVHVLAQPDEFWTDEQWAELRSKVREALKKETLPSLKD